MIFPIIFFFFLITMKSEDARRSLCASEPQTRLIFYVFANDRHSNWRYSEGCLECWHEHKYDKKTPLDYLMIDHNLHFNIKLNCTIVESRARPLKVNCAITFCVSYTDEMRLAAWLAHWHHFAMKHWSAGHPLNPRRHSPTFFFFFEWKCSLMLREMQHEKIVCMLH